MIKVQKRKKVKLFKVFTDIVTDEQIAPNWAKESRN